MFRINVHLSYVMAERLWPLEKTPAGQIQISSSLNIMEVTLKGDDKAEVPFICTINYVPPVAQLTVKGQAYVIGDADEVKKLRDSYQKKEPNQIIVQAISNNVLIEATLVSRILSIPPPIPLPTIPQTTKAERSPPPSYVS